MKYSLRPAYEDPVDGLQDIFDRDIKILDQVGAEYLIESMKKSSSETMRKLANHRYIPQVIL